MNSFFQWFDKFELQLTLLVFVLNTLGVIISMYIGSDFPYINGFFMGYSGTKAFLLLGKF